jgi:hypothetical protein
MKEHGIFFWIIPTRFLTFVDRSVEAFCDILIAELDELLAMKSRIRYQRSEILD